MKLAEKISLALVSLSLTFLSVISAQEVKFGAVAWAFATYSESPTTLRVNGQQVAPSPIPSGMTSVGLLFPEGATQVQVSQDAIAAQSKTFDNSSGQSHVVVVFNHSKPDESGKMEDSAYILPITAAGMGKGSHFRVLYVAEPNPTTALINETSVELKPFEPSGIIRSGSLDIQIGPAKFEVAPGEPEDLLVVIYKDRDGTLKQVAVSDQNLVNPRVN